MILDGRTLVLVADGGRARLFEEARRGGPLHEHPDWLADLAPRQRPSPGPQGGVHDRMGHASHATAGTSPRDKAETDFLVELTRRVEQVFHRGRFDHLVLIAAPRALGLLRLQLSTGLRAKLSFSEPHDRLAASAADLREVMARLRRLSA